MQAVKGLPGRLRGWNRHLTLHLGSRQTENQKAAVFAEKAAGFAEKAAGFT